MVGGPQNMYNLFSQFPNNSYSILTSYQATHTPGLTSGSALAGQYEYFDKPLPPGPWQPSGAVPTDANPGTRYPFGIRTLVAYFATPIKIFLMARKAIRIVRRDRCSIILGISDHGPALIAAGITSFFTGRPYVLYLFDLYRGNNFSFSDNLLAKLIERRLFTHAKYVVLTNEGTEQLYHQRYGTKIVTAVVHNATFPELFTAQPQYDPKPPFTITFTGNVYWAQEQSVLNLIHALEYLQDIPVQLKLYSPTPTVAIRQAVAGKKNIWLGAASQAEMPAIQSAATLLFLPLAWNTQAPEIIATATPGKFTDYLASGRPMLIHAPNYAFVCAYARQHNLGLVVDQNDPRTLAEAIRTFLRNPAKGQEYITNALRSFQENHDARKNAQKLTKILNLV